MAPAPPPHTSPTWVGVHGASVACVGPQRLAIGPTHPLVHAHPVAQLPRTVLQPPPFWTAHPPLAQAPPVRLPRAPTPFPTPLGPTWRATLVWGGGQWGGLVQERAGKLAHAWRAQVPVGPCQGVCHACNSWGTRAIGHGSWKCRGSNVGSRFGGSAMVQDCSRPLLAPPA
jgi:hypothetical protein